MFERDNENLVSLRKRSRDFNNIWSFEQIQQKNALASNTHYLSSIVEYYECSCRKVLLQILTYNWSRRIRYLDLAISNYIRIGWREALVKSPAFKSVDYLRFNVMFCVFNRLLVVPIHWELWFCFRKMKHGRFKHSVMMRNGLKSILDLNLFAHYFDSTSQKCRSGIFEFIVCDSVSNIEKVMVRS